MTNSIRSDLALKKRVGIIGGNLPDTVSLKNAERMGELIAKNGYILVNGGMKGVMEASARGAKSANGIVIGILPGKSRDDCNSFVDIAIPTGLGYMRNPMVVLNSDIVVAIDGSYGTLSEIAYTQIYNRTVFGLNTWNIKGVIPLATPEEVINRINEYFRT
ncbi:MAG: TIGR00725 family protein [Candidatus Aminicenantes bacterium]|jgi:hypothetical protein